SPTTHAPTAAPPPPFAVSPPGVAELPPGFAEAVPLAFGAAVPPAVGKLVALGASEGLESPGRSAPLGPHAVDASSSAPRTAAAAVFLIALFPLVNRAPCVVFFALHDLYARRE
ncbi:hypothetical protein ACFCV9_41695, partial [Streptomyces sp. NPDC056367]